MEESLTKSPVGVGGADSETESQLRASTQALTHKTKFTMQIKSVNAPKCNCPIFPDLFGDYPENLILTDNTLSFFYSTPQMTHSGVKQSRKSNGSSNSSPTSF